MKAEFINPFLSSMSNVLATMAMLQINAGKASMKQDAIPNGDVTGVIAMRSPQTVGTLAVSFPAPVILAVAERMLGESFGEIDDAICDLVGELTNMVTGGAKQQLALKGYDFDMDRPEIIVGRDTRIARLATLPAIVIPFACEAGEFHVEVCFTPLKAA